ncbi:hypothetical protein ACJ5NV_15085 [Loktanella agnita]|uniref:hypothetical protein n=1 Tax=Loktanella agnita TaxID=287097 RepID=UPI0039868DA3
MVRRKKPKITGADPNYSHTFERFRAVESDMPPDVKIPGVNEQSANPSKDATTTNEEAAVVEPKVSAAETKTPAPKAKKPVAKPKAPKAKKIAARPKPKPAEEPNASNSPRDDRQITLDAAVRIDQAHAMQPLIEKGLQQRDIVMLAGRRATEKFVLSPTFVPKPDADRLPMQDGYHTSKRLDGAILDAMRDEHDPLRVRSDPAMVRGQFETLFWEMLDDVIAELIKKYT